MRKHALHVITTGGQSLDEAAHALRSCRTEMIDALHIREKHLGARELMHWADTIGPLIPNTALIINDRLDVALASHAQGVQLTGSSLTPSQARSVATHSLKTASSPTKLLLGCSVHSPEEAARAADLGADYVLFGHIFPTGSKPGLAPRGLQALRHTVEASSVPVIAIGGITPDNTDDVLAAGCAGIAVLSSILAHRDPAGQTERYREALDRSPYTPRKPFPFRFQ